MLDFDGHRLSIEVVQFLTVGFDPELEPASGHVDLYKAVGCKSLRLLDFMVRSPWHHFVILKTTPDPILEGPRCSNQF